MHVTVLMAVYNGSESVLAAIESIRGQTYNDWDLLVVDDASTDGTWGLLRSVAECDTRITIVRNPVNLGLAASLNLGWRQARGDLIARTDADDVSFPKRLERQVEFMRAHPEVAVLGTGAELVGEPDKFLGITFRHSEHKVLVSKIYKENPFIHPSVMMRRRFLEALGGYDERLRRSQDQDLWLRGYRRFQFHNLHETLIRYRVRRGPSLNAILSGTFVLGRAAYRERRWLGGSWYALRFLLVGLLKKMGPSEMQLD